MMMYCAVCIGVEVEEPAEAMTIIHGYAVCIPHYPLMEAGTIWPDVLFKARGGSKEKPPPPPPVKPAPFAKGADGVDIFGAFLPPRLDLT